MHKKLLTTAVLTLTGLLAACAPSSSSMPALSGAHINVPAIPLPAGTNISLDSATVDQAAAAACTDLGSGASATAFYDSYLGQWSATQLATVDSDVTRQHQLLGNLFVSGYFGGVDLRAAHGSEMDAPSNSPFAGLSGLVDPSTSVATLDALVGRILVVANGNESEVYTSVQMFPSLLNQVIGAANDMLAQPAVPADGAALLQALVNAANATLTAANAGVAGDVAAGRRAEEAATGILTWAVGYYLGLMATNPITAPSLTC